MLIIMNLAGLFFLNSCLMIGELILKKFPRVYLPLFLLAKGPAACNMETSAGKILTSMMDECRLNS